MNSDDAERAAAALEATGDYRVLRRLKPRSTINTPDGSPTKQGIFLDLETTGLDSAEDEIIEIAMIPFTYSVDGRIFELLTPFNRLRQPTNPIASEITAITGITNEMVKGKTIDPGDIEAFIGSAALIIAHNAAFDRPFAERFYGAFMNRPWACSMAQVPWEQEGIAGTKLTYLAAAMGFFFGEHRALEDCRAGIELLTRPLPKSGALAFAKLLEVARKDTYRIWAENSSFDCKDVLKARGYRWNGDANGKPRAWYVDVSEGDLDAELAFLRSEIFRRNVDLPMTKVTAINRFSERA